MLIQTCPPLLPRTVGKSSSRTPITRCQFTRTSQLKSIYRRGGESADCSTFLKFHANALFPLSGDAASSTQTRVGIKTRVCVNDWPGPSSKNVWAFLLSCLKLPLPPVPQQGQVDCWPLPCPPVDCEFTVVPEGECCPRCITDPCQADTIRNDITKTCTDEHSISRFSGSSWIKHGTECTLCQCKVSKYTPLRSGLGSSGIRKH